MSYAIRTAIDGMLREKWINLLCVLSIGTGLFVLAASLVLLYNVKSLAGRLPDSFSMTVFLEDAVGPGEAREIMGRIKDSDAVKDVKFISKDDALKELKEVLYESDTVLDGLDHNPLPASVEVRLRKGAVTDKDVEVLVSEIRKLKGVQEVQYGRKLLSAIQSVKKHSESMGLALVGALSAGVLFVCYSTVKILFYRKKTEIDTLKLLGATKGFIRAPFLIEGGVLGLAGGLISSLCMLFIYYLVYFKLGAYLPLLSSLKFPAEALYVMPPAGLVVGMLGAHIAVGRITY